MQEISPRLDSCRLNVEWLEGVVRIESTKNESGIVSDSEAINPYQAPLTTGDDAVGQDPFSTAQASQQYEPASLPRTATRWFLICGISCLPSFFWGLMGLDAALLGMITGVLLFAIGYTALDYGTRFREFRKNPTISSTLKVVYGTRIIITILVPVAAYLDLVCGMGAVVLSQAFLGEFGYSGDLAVQTYIGATVTTLIQGFILNFVLLIYASLILLVRFLFRVMTRV